MSEQSNDTANRTGKLRRYAYSGLLWILLIFCGTQMVTDFFVRCRHRQGPLTACKSNLKNIGTAMEMYSTDWSGRYPRNLDTLTPNYLKTIPECRNAHRVTYKADFGLGAPFNSEGFQDYYYIECSGRNHDDVNVPVDYPKYDGITGLIER